MMIAELSMKQSYYDAPLVWVAGVAAGLSEAAQYSTTTKQNMESFFRQVFERNTKITYE